MIQELVSVIIPTYKGSSKIKRAVDSVLTQDYENLEIIVVDDNGLGTQEQLETERVISHYYSDKRFRYIAHDKNKNGAAARNTAIRVSNGKYLCFLDDDDVFLPHKTRVEVEKLESMPETFGMVYGAVEEVVSEKESWKHDSYFEQDFLYHFLAGELIACSSTVMITRAAMNAVVEWDESFRRHQDWEFFARVANQFEVAFVDEVVIKKYKYDQNLPKDGHLTEKYRDHFLTKMEPIISQFEQKKQDAIRDHHYMEVGKVYLKNKDMKNALRMAMKTKNRLKTFTSYGVDGFAFALRKLRS